MMDGVENSDNSSDDAYEAWNIQFDEAELAVDNLITGSHNSELRFVRAGGEIIHLELPVSAQFLSFYGWMMHQVYTRSILPADPNIQSNDIYSWISQLVAAVNQAMMTWVFTGSSQVLGGFQGFTDVVLTIGSLAVPTASSVVIEELDDSVITDPSVMFSTEQMAALPDTDDMVSSNLGFVPETEARFANDNVMQLTEDKDCSAVDSQHSGPVTRARARVCKSDTPAVTLVVRRSPRNNNNGFMHTALPDRMSRRRPSAVSGAVQPQVMQVAEIRKIGVLECDIDPEELTEARIHRERHNNL